MRIVKKTMLLATAVLILVTVAGAAVKQVQRKKQALARAPKFGVGPVPVHVVEARSANVTQSRQYLAVVEPVRTAEVSARLTAEIQSVACDEGDVVQAGAVLGALDSREIQEGIAASEAQIQQSQEDLQASQVLVDSLAASTQYWGRELARDQSLRAGNAAAISLAEVEATEEKLQLKQGELASARHRMSSIQHGIEAARDKKRELETTLAYCTIVSPFDGVVTKRMVDPGYMAVPGKVLFRVEDRSIVRLVFDVPQGDLDEIRPGLQVAFKTDEKSCRFPLSRLYPSLDAVRMTRAEVDVPGGEARDLITGTYLSVSVELRTFTAATVIPASSLVGSAAVTPTVFVVQQDQLVLRPVTVLASQHNELAVAGVQAGEQVVVHTFLGWTRYYQGQKVEVIQ